MSSNSLQIHPSEKAPLSKAQKEFNRLTKRIGKLRQQIAEETGRADALLKRYHEIMQPALTSRLKALLGLGFAMEEAMSRFRLGKRQKEDVGGSIVYVLDEVFKEMEPTEEAEALYGRWSDLTYKELREQEEYESKESFQDFVKFMYDVEIDLDKIDDPEELERVRQEIEQKQAGQANQHAHGTDRERKNKRHEKAAERKAAKEKAEAELKNKSVRSIYISLVKLIHPDTEADPAMRADKEEEMKRLTQAYEANDLNTLLQMEFKWIHQHEDKLSSLTDEKLNLYNAVLRDQERELEVESWSFWQHDRYAVIWQWIHMKAEVSERAIKKQARRMTADGKEFNRISSNLKKGSPSEAKEVLMEFVRRCVQEANRAIEYDLF